MSGIHPEELLLAYRLGMFPMAENRFAEDVLWIRPRQRGILPLENFHVPRRLARTVRADRYTVRVDQAFPEVIRGCAADKDPRPSTPIADSPPPSRARTPRPPSRRRRPR